MPKKIEITNETNELNFLFGGYFSGRGNIGLIKINSSKLQNYTSTYKLYIEIHFDEMKFAKLFQKNFGGYIFVIPKSKPKPKLWNGRRSNRNIRCYVPMLEANDFLSAIEPYIIDKKMKKKIKVAREYHKYQQKNLWRKTEQVRKQKHKFYLQMRGLK